MDSKKHDYGDLSSDRGIDRDPDSDCDLNRELEGLFRIALHRFMIRFEARRPWSVRRMEPRVRGRLGFSLKRANCRFSDFRGAVCGGCEHADNCSYVSLFSPNMGGSGTMIRGNAQAPRPFVFTLDSLGDGRGLEKGQAGAMEFCLFGDAVCQLPLFARCACEALESFPLDVVSLAEMVPARIDPDFPRPGLPDQGPARMLTDFLHWAPKIHRKLWVDFVTPVRIVSGGKMTDAKSIRFENLALAAVHRLRDLKRCFGMDNDMAKLPDAFFKLAGKIRVEQNRLRWENQKRYSKRQGQDVFLSGLTGQVQFSGPVDKFKTLLMAAQMTHIGKGTSNGNGRIRIAPDQRSPNWRAR